MFKKAITTAALLAALGFGGNAFAEDVKGNSVGGNQTQEEVQKNDCTPAVPVKEVIKNRKPNCADMYNGQGMCLQDTVAASLGLAPEDSLTGYCPGKKIPTDAKRNPNRCYDTSNMNNLSETLANLNIPSISDLEQFALGLDANKCKADYETLQAGLRTAEMKKTAWQTAEKDLGDYVASVMVTEENPEGTTDVLTPYKLLSQELVAEEPKVDLEKAKELMEAVDSTKKAYVEEVQAANDYVEHLKKVGCDFKHTERESNGSVDVSLTGRAVAQGIGDDGFTLAGEVDLDVIRSYANGWGVGGFLNANVTNYFEPVSETENTVDESINFLTQDVTSTTEYARRGAVGVVAEKKLAPWASVYARAGGALVNEKTTKDIVRNGETLPRLTESSEEFAFEGSLGFSFTPWKGLTIDAEGRGNSLGLFDATLGLGYTWKNPLYK